MDATETPFAPPDKIGMLLAFQGLDVTEDRETFERLVPGGYILSNRSLPFTGEVLEHNPELHERYSIGTIADKRKIIDEIKFDLVLSPAASCSLGVPRRGIRRGNRANCVVEESAPPTQLFICGFIPTAERMGYSPQLQ